MEKFARPPQQRLQGQSSLVIISLAENTGLGSCWLRICGPELAHMEGTAGAGSWAALGLGLRSGLNWGQSARRWGRDQTGNKVRVEVGVKVSLGLGMRVGLD
ncbi:hypothetical protein TIFTF001_022650 [Ficus carica]|uniref:Uncharacterized protein n=1 Tax=Ficus carica TaxID=3494 RepID=A0AA88DFP3_FICCA|nr:hypothetical protein TIFTF001_022650 [Ficus carica]